LLLDFPTVPEAEAAGYRRSLDLDTAVASVEYTVRGVAFRRDVLASYPAKVIVIHLSASRPGNISFQASLKSAHEASSVALMPSGELSMAGRVEDSSIRFEARLAVQSVGGGRRTRGREIAITDADSATLILTGATNFQNYQDVTADPHARLWTWARPPPPRFPPMSASAPSPRAATVKR
jgi:alpha-L-fucosidase 2